MTVLPQENLELIQRVLGQDYLDLRIERLVLNESMNNENSSVQIDLSDPNGKEHALEGTGVGLVDALFNAFLARFAPEYQSLNSIEIARFSVKARLDTKKQKAGVDAVGEVVLDVRNSEGKIFSFSDSSRSISSSTARSVLAAVEYFMNAERAFITLYRSRQDARERNRDDLVTRYTRELAEVVKSTSYADVLEGIKKDL